MPNGPTDHPPAEQLPDDEAAASGDDAATAVDGIDHPSVLDVDAHPPLDTEHEREAVADLRRARRRRRLGDKEWGELAYRAYTTSLAAIVAVVFASGLIGDSKLDASATATFTAEAPAWIGLIAAVGLLIGIRSGSRGGPVALELQDVHHLLLAPVDRGVVLRRPAVGIVGYGIAGGALFGGLAAVLFDQRLQGAALPWLGAGALFGATTMALSIGAGLLTSSRLTSKWIPLAIAWLLAAWALADATGYAPTTAPTTWLGQIAIWPLRFEPVSLVPVAVAAVLPAVGLATIGGLSIELARRRTALVGQLRFAATQQDLRTVVLLRRQLAAEHPRGRPWFPGLPRFLAIRFPVLARDLRSIARWPIVRIARVLVIAVAIGLTVRAMWAGNTPLILVAGLLSYIAALDAEEPLAQEIDHPGLLSSQPVAEGIVLLRHLAQPVIVMTLVGVIAAATAYAVDPTSTVLSVAVVVVLPAALAAVSGAAVTVVSESILDTSQEGFVPPEVAGPRLLIRTVWPPAIAVIGFAPLLVARAAATAGRDPAPAAGSASIAVVVLGALVFLWVRFRADIHRSMAEAGMGRTA